MKFSNQNLSFNALILALIFGLFPINLFAQNESIDSIETPIESLSNLPDTLDQDSVKSLPLEIDSLTQTALQIDSTQIDSIISDSLNSSNRDSLKYSYFPTADTALGQFHLGFFIEAKLQFVNFKDRGIFQQNLDTLYYRARRDTFNIQQGIRVSKVDFQKVNLTFPVYLGVEIPLNDFFRMGISAGILYTAETALLIEGSRTSELRYEFLWYPIQYEIQLNLTEWLIYSPEFPQLFIAARMTQLLGKGRLEFQGRKAESNPNEILGGGFAFGGRRKLGEMLELETQLGLDFQSLEFDKKWKDLWSEYPKDQKVAPQLNTFWFAIRLVYKI